MLILILISLFETISAYYGNPAGQSRVLFPPQNYYPFYYPPHNQFSHSPGHEIPVTPNPLLLTQGNHYNYNYNPQQSIFSHFLLPRQVRVPGRIVVERAGDNVQIHCEFPRFLLLVQQIHWQHTPFVGTSPYPTFFDTRNHFAPKIRIENARYKSVLTITSPSEDDFGYWRCQSSALLPEDNAPDNTPLFYNAPVNPYHQGYNYDSNFNNPYNNNYILKKRSVRSVVVRGDKFPPVFAPFYKPNYGLFGVWMEVPYGAPLIPSRVGPLGGGGLGGVLGVRSGGLVVVNGNETAGNNTIV